MGLLSFASGKPMTINVLLPGPDLSLPVIRQQRAESAEISAI